VKVANDGIVALDHEIAKGEPNSGAEIIKLTSKFLADEGI